jgi:hypothetical protein
MIHVKNCHSILIENQPIACNGVLLCIHFASVQRLHSGYDELLYNSAAHFCNPLNGMVKKVLHA